MSVHHNLTSLKENVATTLLGVGKLDILNINLNLIFNGLTDKENEVLETVKDKYFCPLGSIAWDQGIWDLNEYNKAINN